MAPWPASPGYTTNSYLSINPSSANASGSFTPTTNSPLPALKVQPGHDLQIIGSSNLIQTLQAASLIDEYNVWMYPVVLGRGKRLFENGARSCALRLVASKVSTTGVVMSAYVPAGDIPLASLSQAEPSAKELTRRATMEK